MKAKKPVTIERNNRIKARYETLDNKKMYRDDYIFGVIAKEFFLSPVTVENIVFNRV